MPQRKAWWVWVGLPDGCIRPVYGPCGRSEASNKRKQLVEECPHLYFEVHEGPTEEEVRQAYEGV